MVATSAAKRFCKAIQKIGTHNGTFHCDEVLAVSMLQMLPECQDAEIVRTRDEAVLKDCDVVVDVGAVYDPSTHRYDHHQRSFTETMSSLTQGRKPWVTRLSSAGLVYYHFGRDVIAQQLSGEQMDDDVIEAVYDRLYETFVEEIDGVDNGINQFDGTPRYQVTSTISARVSRLNPAWNQPAQDTDQLFRTAMQLVSGEFVACLRRIWSVWLPARKIVAQAITDRHKVHESGFIMELPAGGVPWKDHLFSLEKETDSEVLFVLFTDQNGNWRVQAVPPHRSSFDMRVPLKAGWRGLRDEQLSALSGIPGCVFVHSAGFIGGATSHGAVLKMALESLQEAGRLPPGAESAGKV